MWNQSKYTVITLLNFGPSGGGGLIRVRGAYLKFFDRQRQNYTCLWSLKCYEL